MYYFLIIITLFFTACQTPTTPQKIAQTPSYYDLNGFFEKEIKTLEQQKVKLQKKIQQNGVVEEHLIDVNNWAEELQVFKESDLNKPSWKHKYSLDSTLIEDSLVLLHYKALDETLNIQVLDIKLENNMVHSILIIKKTSSQIYESQQYLTYIPQKSYSIKNSQDVVLIDKNEYHIEAKFIHS